MKSIITYAVITAAIFTMASSVQASDSGEWTGSELDVANKVLLCTKDLAKVVHPSYTRITAAAYVEEKGADGSEFFTTRLTLTTTYPAPSFASYEKVLVIQESLIPSNNTAPDAPGRKLVVTCTLEE